MKLYNYILHSLSNIIITWL